MQKKSTHPEKSKKALQLIKKKVSHRKKKHYSAFKSTHYDPCPSHFKIGHRTMVQFWQRIQNFKSAAPWAHGSQKWVHIAKCGLDFLGGHLAIGNFKSLVSREHFRESCNNAFLTGWGSDPMQRMVISSQKWVLCA